uniref:(northern house mosquito) hypothetical protein n=1 Tax=Culex pipiens TaxID=7175 RepID=A0A8D8KZL5_CULPI
MSTSLRNCVEYRHGSVPFALFENRLLSETIFQVIDKTSPFLQLASIDTDGENKRTFSIDTYQSNQLPSIFAWMARRKVGKFQLKIFLRRVCFKLGGAQIR